MNVAGRGRKKVRKTGGRKDERKREEKIKQVEKRM